MTQASLPAFSRVRAPLSVCAFLLTFLLSACSLGGGNTGTVTNTSNNNTSAKIQPTSALAQPMSAPAISLTTYTGNGFRIGYPAGWTINKATPSAASVIFINPTRTSEFVVTVIPNPDAGSTTSAMLDPLTLSMQSTPHYQQVTLAHTSLVGGEIWDQVGAIGDLPYKDQSRLTKVIALACNHPAHDPTTKMYKIQYSALVNDFDQLNSSTFQPMVQSYKFV